MKYNWNWGIFFEMSPNGVNTYLGTMMFGMVWTLATALSAWIIALTIGSLIGVLRTAPNAWLVRFANGYVELFRNIPLLVQMFLWYFVLPEVVPSGVRHLAQAIAECVLLHRGRAASVSTPRRASPSRCAPES